MEVKIALATSPVYLLAAADRLVFLGGLFGFPFPGSSVFKAVDWRW